MSLRQIDKFITWDARQKRFLPNMWRREILPSWMAFTPTDTTLPFPIAAAGAPTRPVTFVQPYTSVEGLDWNLGTPFEVRSLVFEDSTDGTAAANFTVRLREVGETREFMNQPVHVRALFGTGQTPFILREPYFFPSQHNIQVQFAKVAGGATTVRAYLCGAQYYPWSPELLRFREAKVELVSLIRRWMNRRKYVTPFWLTSEEPVSMLANGSAEAMFRVGDDGQFEAFGHCVVSTGNFRLQLTEVKTRQTLMNGQITQVNGCGDARFPTIYPTPYLLPAGYRMRALFTDLSGAPNSCFFTFFGRRVYAPFTKVQEVLRDTQVIPTPADSPTAFSPKPL